MHIAEVNRTELLELGARPSWNVRRSERLKAPRKDHCLLVWLDSGNGNMPDIIATSDGETAEFLAWANAYLPHLSPLSALVSVMDVATLKRIRGTELRPSIESFHLAGLLGLVHGEVVAACRGRLPPPEAGITPFTSTFSWLVLQAVRRVVPSPDLEEVLEWWTEARTLLNAHHPGYRADHVARVWRHLLPLLNLGGQSAEASDLSRFLQTCSEGKPRLEEMNLGRQFSRELRALSEGPLEARVEIFQQFNRTLRQAEAPSPAQELLLGYALSLISQGSFRHGALLRERGAASVGPLLWYSWFEFCRDLEAGTVATASASQRLLRYSGPTPASPLRVDVSLEELRVLGRMSKPFGDSLIDLRHPLTVEVTPSVTMTVQSAPIRRRTGGPRRGKQGRLFE